MDIRCPSCAAEGRLEGYAQGQQILCTRCGHGWVPRVPQAVFRARRGGPGDPPHYDRWVRRWSITAGIWLLVGFLVPLVIQGYGYRAFGHRDGYGAHGRTTIWFWDMLDAARGTAAHLAILLPGLVGTTALIVGGVVRGRARSITVFSLGAGTILLSLVLASDEGLRLRGIGRIGRGGESLWLLLLAVAGTAIAVGNRIRKHHPTSLLTRLLAGIGGCVIVVLFLVPVERSSLIEFLFASRSWRRGWPLALIFVLVLVYAILGLCHFGGTRSRGGLCLAVSVFGRMIVVGIPLAALVGALKGTDGEEFGMVLLMALKVTLIVYGVLALLSVGLAGWLADVVAPRALPSAADGGPVHLGDLKSRLERLKAALDDGLLTQEEYDRKRQHIVDTADF